MERFLVRELHEDDANEVAAVHERCFEGYFLTQLGRAFLRRYYASFCRHDSAYGVIARDRENERVAAFVVGTADTQAHFRVFYRRNMLSLLLSVPVKFVTNPIIRRQLLSRTSHIKTAALSLVPGLKRRPSKPIGDRGPDNQYPLRLLSIAAAPEYRGSGAADLVSDRFEQFLRADGHKRVGLSVHADNRRAIAFYEKQGWELTHSSDVGWWFEKDL